MPVLHYFNRSLTIAIISCLFLAIVWWLPWIQIADPYQSVDISILNTTKLFTIPIFWSAIVQFITNGIIICVVLSQLFFRQVDSISYIFIFLALLLTSTLPSLHLFDNATVATLLTIYAGSRIFKINFKQNSSIHIINSIIAVFLASLFRVEFICLLPIFVAAAFVFDSIGLRQIIAMLFSVFLIALFLFTVDYLYSIDLVSNYLFEIKSVVSNINFYNIKLTIDLAVTMLCALVLATLFFVNGTSNSSLKVRALKEINFVFWLWIAAVIIILLQSGLMSAFFLLFIYSSSLLIAIRLREYQPKANNIIFLVFVFLLLLAYILQYFLPQII